MKIRNNRQKIVGLLAGLGCTALVQATEPDYSRLTIDDALTGAAFVVSGNLLNNPRPELVASAFGPFAFGPMGPIPPAAGQVVMYRNAQPGNRPNAQLDRWIRTNIVSEADGITFPNRPQIENVDGKGDPDVIVPGGYFFDTFLGNARGSITWWESRKGGKRWIRHDVVTDSPFSYHSVLF